MTKIEFIKKIAGNTEMTQKDVGVVVEQMINTIVEEVAKGEKVTFTGFGTFEARERAERNGVNPQTKEPMVIPATVAPAFKAGKAFKEAVKK